MIKAVDFLIVLADMISTACYCNSLHYYLVIQVICFLVTLHLKTDKASTIFGKL